MFELKRFLMIMKISLKKKLYVNSHFYAKIISLLVIISVKNIST